MTFIEDILYYFIGATLVHICVLVVHSVELQDVRITAVSNIIKNIKSLFFIAVFLKVNKYDHLTDY